MSLRTQTCNMLTKEVHCAFSSFCLSWYLFCLTISIFCQFSCSVMSDCLQIHGLQHTRLPCPSTPGACSNSCPSSQWCHPIIPFSVVPFSSCLQSFPASRSFQMSQFFLPGGNWLPYTDYSRCPWRSGHIPFNNRCSGGHKPVPIAAL